MSSILMIDGNSLANRAFYGVPQLTNAKGVPTNAIYGFINTLQSVIDRFKPDDIFVAFDISKKVFRHEKYAEYKGTRSGMPEDLRTQMPLIKEALQYMNIETIGIEGYEADDIIGTVSRHYSEAGNKGIILSGDRDLFQLVDENITVCFPKSKGADMEIVTPEFLKEFYDMTPELVVELKGLMGDKSDNIPGITGVGEKTARKLLAEHGNIETLYNNLEEYKGKKLYDKLLDGKADAFMSKDLATIKRDIEIDYDAFNFKFEEPDIAALAVFYKELGLIKLLKKLETDYGMMTLDGIVDDKKITAEGAVCASVEEAVALLTALAPSRYVMIVDVDDNKEPQRFSWRAQDKNFTVKLNSGEWAAIVAALHDVLIDENTYIVTDDVKKLSAAFLTVHAPVERIVWDTVLSDYILQPEGNSHELERLVETYLNEELPDNEEAAVFASLEAIQEMYPVLRDKMIETGCVDLYKDVEVPLASVLNKMELNGIRVNTDYLKDLQKEFDERIVTIENEIESLAGEKFNINSPKQLGHILFEVLNLPVIKKTKTGYSTSAEVLEALQDQHPIIDQILNYRQLAKLKSTYVDGLLKLVDEQSKVHTSFNQTVTATGRLSSTSPNLQNIPVRTSEGKRIRCAFIPVKKENLLISADYSQIELRVLAHLSGDEMLMKAFLEDEDIHRRTASEVFHVDMEEVTADQRRTAKAVNFGIIYGQTDYGLSKELGITRKEAGDYIDLYFSRYPKVETFIKETVEKTRNDGYVTTMLGRRRYIKDINSRNRNLRLFAERTAVNSPIQGTAADIIKLAMLRCDQAIKVNQLHATMLLQVHDELIFEVTKEDAMALGQVIRKSMEEAVSLQVPLKIDLKAGFNWQEMENI